MPILKLYDESAQQWTSIPTLKGERGPQGLQGPQGDPGQGIPSGGVAGEVLVKSSSSDYDCFWSDNKVSKTGDIITGVLSFNDQTLTAGSSAEVWGDHCFNICDSSGTFLGGLQGFTKDNKEGIGIIARRDDNVEAGPIINGLILRVHDDGTRSVVVHDQAAWCKGINAVYKDGDSMTGPLTLKTTLVHDSGVADSYGTPVRFWGKTSNGDDYEFGWIMPHIYGSNEELSLTAIREVNGSKYYNGVNLGFDANGNAIVYLGQINAWKKTLGIDSEEVTTNSSVITADSGFSISSVDYRRWGKVVHLSVTVERTGSAITTATNCTVGTIVSGKRPGNYAPIHNNTTDFIYGILNGNGSMTARMSAWSKNGSKTFRTVYLLA